MPKQVSCKCVERISDLVFAVAGASEAATIDALGAREAFDKVFPAHPAAPPEVLARRSTEYRMKATRDALKKAYLECGFDLVARGGPLRGLNMVEWLDSVIEMEAAVGPRPGPGRVAQLDYLLDGIAGNIGLFCRE